jgi:hypothetical protein
MDGWRILAVPGLILGVAAPPPHPQAYVFGRASFPTGGSPIAIAWGDLDEDGVLDIATADQSSSTVSVLLGTPRGVFRPPIVHPTASTPRDLAIRDFDGDGVLDLVVIGAPCAGGCDVGSLSIFLGNGDGSLQHAFDVPMASEPQSVRCGDFDGDGYEDIVVASTLQSDPAGPSSPVIVLLGNGDGTFSTQTFSGIGRDARSMAVTDVDSDGHLDLAITRSNFFLGLNALDVSLGNGDGTFRPPTSYPLSAGKHHIEAADLDGDDAPDLAIANWDSTVVSVLLNNGHGRFPGRTDLEAGSRTFSLAIGDLGHDGRLDLIATSAGPFGNGGSVVVLRGHGDGTFQPFEEYVTGQPSVSVLVGPIDSDDHMDVVFTSYLAHGVTVLLGTASGTFDRPDELDVGDDPVGVAAADFDRDGELDLAVVEAFDSSVSLRLGVGDGTFQPPTRHGAGRSPTAVIAADFDGDDRPDVAVTNGQTGTVSVLLGDGQGGLLPRHAFVTGPSPQAIASGDFDEDGTLDLAVAAGGVSLLLGAGDGSFLPRTEYLAGWTSVSLVAADFDRDGHLDLAVADGSPGSGSVTILLGRGDGGFAFPISFLTVGRARSIASGDFDGDSYPDLAVATQYGQAGNVVVFLGRGDGSFRGPTSYFVGGALLTQLSCGDLNGDDRPDLAVGSRTQYTVGVFKGRGDGTFALQAHYGVGGEPRSIALGLFDEDAQLDMAVASYPKSLDLFLSVR